MKTEDFNRLKEICEKEGFELSLDAIEGYNQEYVFRVSKKDSWEGVEFVDISGLGIRKISLIETSLIYFLEMECDKQFGVIGKSKCKPSTEQAYIEQLKKTAYEKFGEIKVGDRFHRENLDRTWGISEVKTLGFRYVKSEDRLYFGNTFIYQQGKWATKIERVKVIESYMDYDELDYPERIGISFTLNRNQKTDLGKLKDFISKQLENYLNNEKQD